MLINRKVVVKFRYWETWVNMSTYDRHETGEVMENVMLPVTSFSMTSLVVGQ